MGLLTDSFFITALRSNEDLVAMLPDGDFYNNVAFPDVDMENVELPKSFSMIWHRLLTMLSIRATRQRML